MTRSSELRMEMIYIFKMFECGCGQINSALFCLFYIVCKPYHVRLADNVIGENGSKWRTV